MESALQLREVIVVLSFDFDKEMVGHVLHVLGHLPYVRTQFVANSDDLAEVYKRATDAVSQAKPTSDVGPMPLESGDVDSDVEIDLERCQVSTPYGSVPLTGQEVRVLDVLSRTPGRFRSAVGLAEHVGQMGAYMVDTHCIRQTICGLRRKLGEHAGKQRLLVSRRGLGYALLLPNPVRSRESA